MHILTWQVDVQCGCITLWRMQEHDGENEAPGFGPVPRIMVSVTPGDKVTIVQHSYEAAMFECTSSLFLSISSFPLVIQILPENHM